ncbi:cupin domain-containing protein [Sphingomonas immobilis]|uniref:Cupin domain-containing protein n=1 Tax=Sphingomonas immobilis TaxID=3063997 RepID=A0ABT8ZT97_9SPHN|nr:cupin domain-containing protein [Sphingomonas sp. CA1-15]MDO7840788.1 cupin domain-containing protein [Sphingomonas sp. CA1-15]
MHVTRAGSAPAYQAVAHHGVEAFRLHGRDVTPLKEFWVGLSDFAPGGGAEKGSSPTAKVYIVVEGAITVVTANETIELGPLDSCLIEADEERIVENRGGAHARMLVVSPS